MIGYVKVMAYARDCSEGEKNKELGLRPSLAPVAPT